LAQEPTPITPERAEQLVKTLLEIMEQSKAYGSVLPSTEEDVKEVIRLIQREPKLLAWSEELRACGGVGVFLAAELRNRLGAQ
jgi:hypothetical protein